MRRLGEASPAAHMCVYSRYEPLRPAIYPPRGTGRGGGAEAYRVKRSAEQLEDKSCVSPGPCSELEEAPCMPRPDRAS